jgi:hypothetical protein
MNETTPLLAHPAESKSPSDDYEQLTNLLKTLSRPQFSKCWRTLSSRRRTHLAQAEDLYKEADRRKALKEAEVAGAPPYVPKYFGDGGALPSEQASELANEQKLFAEEFGRQLDVGYNIFTEAERLLGKVSPQLLNQWPLGGVEELMKLRPEMAARTMREILQLVLVRAKINSDMLNCSEEHHDERVVLRNEKRDEWLYNQFCKMERDGLVPHKEIRRRLREKCNLHGWRLSEDIKTLKDAANRWATANHKPLIPKRQHGRRAAKRT